MSTMKISIGPVVAAMVLVGTAVTGCTDLSPLDREFKDIQAQLNQVSTDVVAMRSSLDQATEASKQAREAADNAARTANQALVVALSAQRSVRATNERLERLTSDLPSK
jgi:outer membrane murein-binding lipoprotein Lpp